MNSDGPSRTRRLWPTVKKRSQKWKYVRWVMIFSIRKGKTHAGRSTRIHAHTHANTDAGAHTHNTTENTLSHTRARTQAHPLFSPSARRTNQPESPHMLH